MAAHFCTARPCPLCNPERFYTAPAHVVQPPGCICPPTSEKTCENVFCPRKNIRISIGAVALPASTETTTPLDWKQDQAETSRLGPEIPATEGK